MKIISKIYYILITIISLNLSTINTFALPMGKFAKKSVDAVEYLKISVPHKGSIAVNKHINEKIELIENVMRIKIKKIDNLFYCTK